MCNMFCVLSFFPFFFAFRFYTDCAFSLAIPSLHVPLFLPFIFASPEQFYNAISNFVFAFSGPSSPEFRHRATNRILLFPSVATPPLASIYCVQRTKKKY